MRRPRPLPALATMAILAAVVTAGFATVGDDRPGTVSTPTSAPSDQAASTPLPEVTPGAEAAPTPPASPPSIDATMVMWSRADLPPVLAERAAALPHVTATAFVRSETLGFVAARDAAGRPVQALTEGFRIPIEVAAVDPAAYAATVPAGPAREAIASLRPGHALLSETAARLRGIGADGAIDLRDLADVRIAGIVPDGTVRNMEVVLHVADADAAGLEPDGSLVVRHGAPPGNATVALADELRALAPDGEPARVVTGRPGGGRIRAPLVLSLPEVKDRFGEFAYRPRGAGREVDLDDAFVEEHIVDADVPILGTVRCHRAIIDDLRAALREVVAADLAQTIDPALYAGCFYPRRISATRDRLSRHSWGIALDMNVDTSQPGLGPPPHPDVIAILGRHGFRWGGDFLVPDNHHFEWIGPEAASRPDPATLGD